MAQIELRIEQRTVVPRGWVELGKEARVKGEQGSKWAKGHGVLGSRRAPLSQKSQAAPAAPSRILPASLLGGTGGSGERANVIARSPQGDEAISTR